MKNFYKTWTKETISVYVLGFIFMAFFAEKLIYTINVWFNFVFGSFFDQDHLLGIYAKRWP